MFENAGKKKIVAMLAPVGLVLGLTAGASSRRPLGACGNRGGR